MNHYESAEQLQGLADEAAKRAAAALVEDPMAAIPPLLGSIVHLIAAQTHATLALVDAINTDYPAATPHQCGPCRDGKHGECVGGLDCDCARAEIAKHREGQS